MAIVVPVPIPESPPVPQRSDPSTFAQRADDYVSWQTDEMAPGIDAQADATYQNALHAQGQAVAAQSSASQAAASATASAQSAADARAAEDSAWLAAAASGSELAPQFRDHPGDIVIINGEGAAMETAPYPAPSEVGDVVFTARELSAPEFLPADGSRYARSEQTSLAEVVGNEPAPPFTRITGTGLDGINDASVAAFSADGSLLAVVREISGHVLAVFRRTGDSYVSVGSVNIGISGRQPYSIAFSGDNKNIAVGFDDGIPGSEVWLLVANVSDHGQPTVAPGFPALLAGSPSTALSAFVGVSFSPSNHRLAVSVGVNGGGGYLMTWARSGATYVIEHSSVTFSSGYPQRELGFSHDGQYLAVCKTGGAGGPVEIFDMSGAAPVALDVVSTVPENLSGYGLAWAPDGTLFVGRNYFPNIIAFIRTENGFRQADDVIDAFGDPVARLSISRDGRFMAVSHWGGTTPEIGPITDVSYVRIRGVTATEVIPPQGPAASVATFTASFGQGAGQFMDSVMVIVANARVGVYRDGYDYDPYTQIVVPDYRDVQRSPTRAYIRARRHQHLPPGLVLNADFTSGDIPGLPSGWFARASKQSFIRQEGGIGFAEPNEPALTWRGDGYALAAEPISVNFLTNTMSMTLANAGFRQGMVSDSPGAYGFGSGISFPTGATATRVYYKSFLVPEGSAYTFSVFVAMEDGSQPRAGNTNDTSADFSLMTRTSGMPASSVRTEHVGGGLWRLSVTGTGTGAGPYHGVAEYPTSHTGKAFRVYGMQLEYMRYPTSYIATDSVAQTRAAITVSIPTAGIWEASVGGVLYVDADWLSSPFAGSYPLIGMRPISNQQEMAALYPPRGSDQPVVTAVSWMGQSPPLQNYNSAMEGRARVASSMVVGKPRRTAINGVLGVSGPVSSAAMGSSPIIANSSAATVLHIRSIRLYNREIDLAKATAL